MQESSLHALGPDGKPHPLQLSTAGYLCMVPHHWNPSTLSYEVVTVFEGGEGGQVQVTNWPSSQAVTGPITDNQLRAAPIGVSGPLTDAQLRAAAVPVSGTLSISGAVAVTGTFWQATQPISAVTLPLPSGAATETTLAAISGKDFATQATLAAVSTAMGAQADAEATGNGSVIALLKRLRTLLGGVLNVRGGAANDYLSVRLTNGSAFYEASGGGGGSGNAMTFVGANTTAPAASAVQADSGALPAGDYEFVINLMVSDTVAVGKGLIVEHRDATNASTLRVLGGASPNGGAVSMTIPKMTIVQNERIRVIAGTAAGAASSRYISCIGRRTV